MMKISEENKAGVKEKGRWRKRGRIVKVSRLAIQTQKTLKVRVVAI